MHQKKLFECYPAHPLRCQSRMNGEQCRFLSMKGMKEEGHIDASDMTDYSMSVYCPKHGGFRSAKALEKRKVRNYRLQVWQERVNEFSESEEVKSLREEIGIVRLLIETVIAQCHEHTDLLLYSSKISDLVMKVERLVATSNKLETSMGMLLDKNTALAMATRIVDIISSEIDDDEAIDRISEGIITALANTTQIPALLEM